VCAGFRRQAVFPGKSIIVLLNLKTLCEAQDVLMESGGRTEQASLVASVTLFLIFIAQVRVFD